MELKMLLVTTGGKILQIISMDYILNIGPFGEEKWWSSDAKNNEVLFLVDAIIAPWSEKDAFEFSKKGYTHYHELLRTDNGQKHPELVVWFKHVGIPHIFSFDKGPVTGGRTRCHTRSGS